MKLGEIKIETLMLVFPSASIDVDIGDDDTLNEVLLGLQEDSNFTDYLVAMPGAINRCFSSLEQREVLPTQSFDLPRQQVDASGKWKYNLSELGIEIACIDHIACYGENYIPVADYIRESSDRILLNQLKNDTDHYTLIYTPKIKRISNITSAEYVVELPDEIACLIPYYLKSELVRIDDNSEASVARELFEYGIKELHNKKDSHQNVVDITYRM